ncbi:hypothetical protein E2542_SST21019 [Spatholobus suberectus]|nr:hypothetical protein E2542_SST21019 [Spatholobus suberectus]
MDNSFFIFTFCVFSCSLPDFLSFRTQICHQSWIPVKQLSLLVFGFLLALCFISIGSAIAATAEIGVARGFEVVGSVVASASNGGFRFLMLALFLFYKHHLLEGSLLRTCLDKQEPGWEAREASAVEEYLWWEIF